jgi:hypothetical protein
MREKIDNCDSPFYRVKSEFDDNIFSLYPKKTKLDKRLTLEDINSFYTYYLGNFLFNL